VTVAVPVELGDHSYDVVVGPGAAGTLPGLLPAGARRAAVVTQAGIGIDVDPGVEHRTFTIPDGEAAKSLSVVEELCGALSEWGLTRADVVVGVGGGVVTDVAGFSASVYHRGVPVIHVATTLLAQVDAAIGGKTGVNLAQGKNLVGAFWQPLAVVCDTDHLSSLPLPELRSGMGEVAKYHFLGGGRLDAMPLDARVAACVRIKAAVVSSDEREAGRRAVLNYGHTLAHALEVQDHFALRHGEAVAVGLVYAAVVARRLGRVDDARVSEHRRVVAAYGLAAALHPARAAAADPNRLIELMSRDKKALRGLTMVLDGPDGVEPVNGLDPDLLRAALADVGVDGARG
jgi:5-deoxy-5-amino-3-dehydroquinate synthase